MKVLHIINAMTVAGAETLVANSLAPGGLAEHGEHKLLFFRGASELCERIDPKVKQVDLSYNSWRGFPGLLRRIRKEIREFRPDVIHTHLNPAGWYTALVCPKDIPQVHTLHISYSDDTDSRKSLVRLERNLLLERKDKNFITLSPRLREDLLQCVNIKGEVYVLSNFIQDSFFEPTPVKPPHSRHFRMVAIGNIRPQKNYDYLLDVFSHLKDSNISVDIYGYGDPARLRERAERENIPVHFKGPAKDSRDIYWRYDAFIMPSKFEGFGLSAYEAMASEVPAILSDLEAFSSLIGDNALYIPLDDARASADIIRGAAENRGALIARAAKAKAYTSATVTRDKYVSSLMSIYEDIAAKNRIREK